MEEKATGWQGLGEPSAVSKLARFFPDASALRIPVMVSTTGGKNPEAEATIIEFGTRREALFACRLPLEFAEKVRLQNGDGSLDAEAWVVAVQHYDGEAAVAARFIHDPPHWVIKL